MGYLAASVDLSLEKQIANAANAGRMFTVETGNYAVTTNGPYAGISVFFAARATKIVLISARMFDSTALKASYLRLTTTDPNFSGHTISNALGQAPAIKQAMGTGGATSGGALTTATEAITATTGTLWRSTMASINAGKSTTEMLTGPADYLIIPSNTAGGYLLIINGANADAVSQSLTWVEI